AETTTAEFGTRLQDRLNDAVPYGGRKGDIEKAGSGHLDIAHARLRPQTRGQPLGNFAWLHACRLGEHECSIAGNVAVRGIAWRRRIDTSNLQVGRKLAGDLHSLERRMNAPLDVRINVHGNR